MMRSIPCSRQADPLPRRGFAAWCLRTARGVPFKVLRLVLWIT